MKMNILFLDDKIDEMYEDKCLTNSSYNDMTVDSSN